MAQTGSNYEKNWGRKSHWTVPLTKQKKLFFMEIPHCKEKNIMNSM